MKDDKGKIPKGFLRNTAINVAQDIVQAGNPLNPGGHIVGSILDGAIMEANDRKMNKNLYQDMQRNKTASEYLDDLYFEKTAGIGTVFSSIGKNITRGVGRQTNKILGANAKPVKQGFNRYKNLLMGGNTKTLTNDMNTAKQTFFDSGKNLDTFNKGVKKGSFANQSQDVLNQSKNNMYNKMMSNKDAYQASKNALNTEKNKVMAARVGTGLAAGHVVSNNLNFDNNKTASEYLDDLYFEKTAGIGNVAKKLGSKILSTKPVKAVTSNPTISRGAELLTGSKAKHLANEYKDLRLQQSKNWENIERQKRSLNSLQRMTGKKFRLTNQQNRNFKHYADLQHNKLREFDEEARKVEKARRTAVGVGAVGLTGANLAKEHIRDKRYLNSMPTEEEYY